MTTLDLTNQTAVITGAARGIGFAIAEAIRTADGNVMITGTDQARLDRAVAALSRRVRVVSDPELDKLFPDFYASIVEVRTRKGRTITRRNDIARGYPEAPLSAEELIAKFERLAGSVMTPSRVRGLGRAVVALPSAPDLRGYAAALRAKARAR